MKALLRLALLVVLGVLLMMLVLAYGGDIIGWCDLDAPSNVRSAASANCSDRITRAVCLASGSGGGWCDVLGGVP